MGKGRRERFVRVLAVAVIAVTAATIPTASAADASSPAPKENVGRGVVLKGLRQGGECGAGFQITGDGHADHRHGCTHGPDPAPQGVDPQRRDGTLAAAAAAEGDVTTAAAAGGVPCYGDGQSGNRVEAIYAYSAGGPSRYSTFLPSVRGWAAEVDRVFASSAAKTGGVRHVRFVTDANCNLAVRSVALSPEGIADIGNTINELQRLGFSRSDRKYLVWVDANVYCGISQIIPDDSPGQTNANNGRFPGMVSRIDNGCWGVVGRSVEAHELMHNFGGVQASAPRSTAANHCVDGAEVMCYADGSGAPMQSVCPSTHSNLFDCGDNDYFSVAPPVGSYLGTHWNAANSSFLTSQVATAPPSTPPAWTPWTSQGAPPGGLASGVDATSWGTGRIDVVARGADDALWHAWRDGAWGGWESLGGVIRSDPTVVSWSSGRLDLFARGADNALWHRWYDNGWHAWERLGAPPGGVVSSIDATSWAPGRLDLVVRGADNALWHTYFDGRWGGWESLGGILTADPSAVSWSAGRLDVFVRSGDNALWHRWYDRQWLGWERLGAPSGGLASGVDADSYEPGRIDVVTRGTDGGVWRTSFSAGWRPWESLGGASTSDPAIVSWGKPRLDVFVRGGDRALWSRSQG